MAKTKYYDSEIGPFEYPHFNRADTKFNPENPVFKGDLVLTGEEAQRQKAKVDAAVDAAFEEFMSDPEQGGKLSPADRKKWSKHYPYEDLEDEAGTIKFHFKQNEKIRLRDGTTKTIVIGLYDAAGNELAEGRIVRHGSEGRVRYSMRPIKITTAKEFGIRLDFAMVQVTKLSEGGGQKGFGAIEGGYEDDGEVPEGGFAPAGGSSSQGNDNGDY
jgi:hypothetical protein